LEFAGGAGCEVDFVEADEEPELEELPDDAGALVGVGAGVDFVAGAAFDEATGVEDAEAEEEPEASLFLERDFFLVEVSEEAALSADCD
jgi:hypothetical protein